MQRILAISAQLIDLEDLANDNNNNNRTAPQVKCSGSSNDGCKDCGPSPNNNTNNISPNLWPSTISRNQTSSSATTPKTPKIITPTDYISSLQHRNLSVWYLGQRVIEPTSHPAIIPSINAVAETYKLAVEDPDLATATSQLTGYRISRFLHVTETVQDVVNQSKMQRKLGQLTGTCFQRCVGMDAINAIFSVTHEIDVKYKTTFHQQFLTFLQKMHAGNFVVGGAMTDGKGDRSKRPSEQHDLDLHLRVVERRVDGIVVRGCKTHQTGCVNSHHLIVMPGGMLTAKEQDFAVAFHVPVDAPGITYVIGRQSCDLRALEQDADVDLGNAKFGGQEAVVIFDNVFIPTSALFMDGQVEFAQMLVERFTAYHRRSYICKAGLGDVLIGASHSIAKMNGAQKASHVKDKLVEMVHLNTTIAATALAASYSSTKTLAGNFQPDVLMANVCKHHVTRFPYEIARLAQDIAGGLVVTLPSSLDFANPATAGSLNKYLATSRDIPVEHRRRMLRLIENLTMGRNAVGYLTESMHGAGSPQAQRVMMQKLYDFENAARGAELLAGIKR